MAFVPELVAMLDNLKQELKRNQISEHSQQWLNQCGLTPEQMKNLMEPEYTPERKLHLYHCDHRGLVLIDNLYHYPLDPLSEIDPLGLYSYKSKNIDDAGAFALAMCNSKSIKENKKYGGVICKKMRSTFR